RSARPVPRGPAILPHASWGSVRRTWARIVSLRWAAITSAARDARPPVKGTDDGLLNVSQPQIHLAQRLFGIFRTGRVLSGCLRMPRIGDGLFQSGGVSLAVDAQPYRQRQPHIVDSA